MDKTKAKGNYDDLAGANLLAVGGRAVVLIVLGGCHGNGFSVAANADRDGASIPAQLPALLRACADNMEREMAAGNAYSAPASEGEAVLAAALRETATL